MKRFLIFITGVMLFIQQGQSQSWDINGNTLPQRPQPFLGLKNSVPLRFKVGNLQRMIIIPSNGFVGIGVNEPKNPLQVHANDHRTSYGQYENPEPIPEPQTEDGDVEPDICHRGKSGGTNYSDSLGSGNTTKTVRGDGEDEDLVSYSAIQVTNCVTGKEANDGVLLSMENNRAYLRQLEYDNFNISMKGNDVITVTPALNVGIGINNPTQKLHVEGSAFFKTSVAIGKPSISPNAILSAYKAERPIFHLASNDTYLEIGIAEALNVLAGGAQPHDVVFRKLGAGHHNLIFYMPDDDHDGNAAIKFGDDYNGLFVRIINDGTMRVDGELIAKAITVKTNVWSDFVFDKDYKLMSLYELEQFINTNKHLPDIPNAAEVEENGIQLGEMQGKLLQKIEELTLYIIEQQKQATEQQKLIEELQKRLSELEAKKGGE